MRRLEIRLAHGGAPHSRKLRVHGRLVDISPGEIA
jgi:hypothetical protein